MASLKDDEQESAQSSKAMMDILKRLDGTAEAPFGDEEEEDEDDENRFEEIDSDDEENIASLAERLGGIDLDNADAVWEQLTKEERMEFQNILESGDVSQIMPELEPWWMGQYKVDLVQSAEGNKLSTGEKELLEKCPPIKKNIKCFKELCSKEPSTFMKFNLANILAAYALTYRYFNGDFKDCIPEAVNCMISICGNFKCNTIYDCEKLAVESVCHECRQEQLPADSETSLLLAQDVEQFFAGPSNCGVKYRKHFVLAALSDAHRLFSLAKKDDQQRQKQGESGKAAIGEFSSKFCDQVGQLDYLEPGQLKSYIKKLDFVLSYAKDYL